MTNVTMTGSDMNHYAQVFAQKQWGVNFREPLHINYRLKRAKGRFVRSQVSALKGQENLRIEVNPKLHGNDDEVKDTIRHELCHWYCYTTGLNFRDGDKDFEMMLKYAKAQSSLTTNKSSKIYQEAIASNQVTRMGLSDLSYETVDKSLVLKSLYERHQSGQSCIVSNFIHGDDETKHMAHLESMNIIQKAYRVKYQNQDLGVIFKIPFSSHQWLALDGIMLDGQRELNARFKTRKDLALNLI